VLTNVLIASVLTITPNLSAPHYPSDGYTQTVREVAPDDTISDFFPENREIGECLGTLPKPNCGSDARGGWAQGIVLIAITGGLGFIGWRIYRSSRQARDLRSDQ
jgi:hypothetical protein